MSVIPLFPPMTLAPARVMRGWGVLDQAWDTIKQYGQRPLVIGGEAAQTVLRPYLPVDNVAWGEPVKTCSELTLKNLHTSRTDHQADYIIGIGGGKALDTAKLVAHQAQCPVITIPTSPATCAAWTALANVYTPDGAFHYDVALDQCPQLLLLDYQIMASAPTRLLVAGIGDALAKWYEASVSSGHSSSTLIIAAVQQARVLRDLLLQQSGAAVADPGGTVWQEVVDATVLLAGMIGGLGGAQCRTVAAHAVHNGLTHLSATHQSLHGEKVAYGILVQLRLEELCQQSQLAHTARLQLIEFYRQLGLPMTLHDLGLTQARLSDLELVATQACQPQSDIHHLPFPVDPPQLLAAMMSTTAELAPPARSACHEGYV